MIWFWVIAALLVFVALAVLLRPLVSRTVRGAGNKPFAVGREAAKRCRVRNSKTLPPGLEVPYSQGVEFVPPERGQFLAVGRKHQRADDLCLARQFE